MFVLGFHAFDAHLKQDPVEHIIELLPRDNFQSHFSDNASVEYPSSLLIGWDGKTERNILAEEIDQYLCIAPDHGDVRVRGLVILAEPVPDHDMLLECFFHIRGPDVFLHG